MSALAPEVVESIDLAMYEAEQPAEPCFVEGCEDEAAWYGIFPHDAPCSIEAICTPHTAAMNRQIAYWMLIRGVMTGTCRDCYTEIALPSVRFERIMR